MVLKRCPLKNNECRKLTVMQKSAGNIIGCNDIKIVLKSIITQPFAYYLLPKVKIKNNLTVFHNWSLLNIIANRETYN